MPLRNQAFAVLAAAAMLAAPSVAYSQSTGGASEHVPLQKSIGQAKEQVVPSLIVMNAKGVSLDGNKLVLEGISPNSIVFADRPVRSAGHAVTANLLEEWAPGNTEKESFTMDPPNATVSAFGANDGEVYDAVVVLKSPTLDGDRLTFDVDVLEGDLTGAKGPAAVFIDIIGRPLTPLSYAGAARRTVRRGAWYAGAPVVAPYAAPIYHPYYHPYYRR